MLCLIQSHANLISKRKHEFYFRLSVHIISTLHS
nr:MAG TPA: hypothetical protein [Caudoviricetes sp.]